MTKSKKYYVVNTKDKTKLYKEPMILDEAMEIIDQENRRSHCKNWTLKEAQDVY